MSNISGGSYGAGIVSAVVVGGVAGAIVGAINRGDDGPKGFVQPREMDESIRRGAWIYGGIGAGLGLLGGAAIGAKAGGGTGAVIGATVGAVSGFVTSAAQGLAYQFAKNVID